VEFYCIVGELFTVLLGEVDKRYRPH